MSNLEQNNEFQKDLSQLRAIKEINRKELISMLERTNDIFEEILKQTISEYNLKAVNEYDKEKDDWGLISNNLIKKKAKILDSLLDELVERDLISLENINEFEKYFDLGFKY